MKSITHRLQYNAEKIPRLIVFSCLHFGHKHVDMDIVNKMRTEMRKPNTYWIDLGDSCEFINTKDPRFDSRILADWITKDDLVDLPRAQVGFYRKMFKDFSGTCLARLSGNHEDKMARKWDRNVYEELNDAIDLPEARCLGYSGIVELILCRTKGSHYIQRIYISHGHVGGRTPGPKANDLDNSTRMVESVDAVFKGHGHMSVTLKPRILSKVERDDRITDYEIACACTGTFKRGEREGYEERSGFHPHGLGWVEYTMHPREHKNGLYFPVFGRSGITK